MALLIYEQTNRLIVHIREQTSQKDEVYVKTIFAAVAW